MARKYGILDYAAITTLAVLALPSPEDVPAAGTTNLIGLVGMTIFYPEIMDKIPVLGALTKII